MTRIEIDKLRSQPCYKLNMYYFGGMFYCFELCVLLQYIRNSTMKQLYGFLWDAGTYNSHLIFFRVCYVALTTR